MPTNPALPHSSDRRPKSVKSSRKQHAKPQGRGVVAAAASALSAPTLAPKTGRCETCRAKFSIPKRVPYKRFCSSKCKKRAYRKHARKQERPAIEHSCAYCCQTFAARRANVRYCCHSHRVSAAKRRNASAVAPLMSLDGLGGGTTKAQAKGWIKMLGMKQITELLHADGWTYDERARLWFRAQIPA